MESRMKAVLALLVALGLIAVACGSEEESARDDESSSTVSAEAEDDAPPNEDSTNNEPASDEGASNTPSILDGAIPCEGQHEGMSVSILSTIRNSDTDSPVEDYVAGYQPLVDCTGVEIVWESTDQFEVEVNVRLEGGNPPDLIEYPQPGLMVGHVEAGLLTSLPAQLASAARSDFIGGWDSYVDVGGDVYALPVRSGVKSLVWYSPSAFAAGGYDIPETFEDLETLSEQMVAEGQVPWCVGAESGVATGWVLTDWIEDFMLRIHGEDVYDQWISHEIPFNDPRVVEVVDAVGAFVKNPDYLGSENAVKAIATTSFQNAGLPLLTDDCLLHRQAGFYATVFPEGTAVGADGDVNFFYLPSPADGPQYLLGGGAIMAAGTDRQETFDVLLYTGSADYQLHIVNTRSELSPNLNLDLEAVEDPIARQLSELQVSADVFRFDASDLMPGEVGAGTFWTESTAWVVGGSTQDFVDNVERSWPN